MAFDSCGIINVTFVNKTGWKAGSSTITEAELSDTSNAAQLLSADNSKYRSETWIRS